ncbi:MAG: Lrp/AsnC family transcriptional regulator [SAR202 cluster bacterium]|nr:Lrp/AsnC family transcriptional regulator [SAR202 cluster bacterium]
MVTSKGGKTRAFVLIETAVGKTKDVVNALHQVKGVASVDVVTGPYDIIAVLEAPDLSSVGEMVTGSVHTIGGIVRTVTCLAVSST